MSNKQQYEKIAEMASALSNPMRVAIIARLQKGPCLVSEIVRDLRERQATVSKQLAILKRAGIVRCRPEGNCREYFLADSTIMEAVLKALKEIGAAATAQLARCRAAQSRKGNI